MCVYKGSDPKPKLHTLKGYDEAPSAWKSLRGVLHTTLVLFSKLLNLPIGSCGSLFNAGINSMVQ